MGVIVTDLSMPKSYLARYKTFNTKEEAVSIIKQLYLDESEVCFGEFMATIAIHECSLEDTLTIIAILRKDIDGDDIVRVIDENNCISEIDNSTYALSNIETLLKEKMAESYNIQIECKGKGRGYEMTYEMTATKVGEYFGIPDRVFYHGIGITIESTLEDVFVTCPKNIEKLKSEKKANPF
jgi:hypothetical protein